MNKLPIIILFCVTTLLWSYRAVRALQMGGYKLSLAEIRPRFIKILIEHLVLSALAAASIVTAVYTGSLALSYGVLFIPIVYSAIDAAKLRTHLKFTKRAVRLCAAVAVVLACLQFVLITVAKTPVAMAICGFCVLILSRAVSAGVCAAISPFESLNNKRYIKRAKEKISSLNAFKIGITGSFGKTSCKNILAEMLSAKYKVIKTEKNYNTPMGLALTAQRIEGDEEVFIAEMGAKREGDIAELANIVKPKYAIITGVAPQHLATFGSEEKIYRAKRELVKSLPPDGFAVFNGDNKHSLKMFESCPVRSKAVFTAANETGIYAGDITLNNNGSSFTVKGIGEDLRLTTRLLGRHNIINILLCLTLALELGIDREAIAEVVKGLKPTPHRLELLDTSNGVTVIDDSYNGNIEGVKFALEILSLYAGKRKVVFTQGIVELGKRQAEMNGLVGAMTAEIADVVILTGENAKYIKEGLFNGGFPADRIYIFKTFREASESLKTILMPGDVLLIQNDIP